MKAITFNRLGPPDVLQLTELPVPSARPGTVRVRVKTAGVMPIDAKVRSGVVPYAQSHPFPIIPGNEFAGMIDEVGDGVSEFARGEEVIGFTTFGGYAEYVVVSSDQLVRKPEAMPWETAGGFTGNGQGAHMALEAIRIQPGDTVLIHGAAGGLGTFAVQLALAWGAGRVIGTASVAHHEHLRRLGAIPLGYGEGLAARVRAIAPAGVDAALHAGGGDDPILQASVDLVQDFSRIVAMVPSVQAQTLGIRQLTGTRSKERLTELVRIYSEGKVDISIRKVVPLDQAQDAHREIESGHGRGKIILSV
ncbi:NADPH:quinone reductase-like Zn-dependent oxidoreductase [Paenibacillus rhizosphaerae]|uniref:NADPH:quinone reductase-like Zn-dependent oxidoreductase n=1 Tax=Paenibacillus rhizosphaerae TaxID=297318 RepID=A0A839TQ17_9BACL|nr:NADP-dependent oxidoreductase [Paenibacillus rhizosphaerae]MBB3129084.1 NADPH:quinone reductase-like Zn-dependent oxidoreductase [Paenibacillus rhizosphaerae]